MENKSSTKSNNTPSTQYKNNLEEEIYTEYALLKEVEEKFSELNKWMKDSTKELKKDMFDFVDIYEYNMDKLK